MPKIPTEREVLRKIYDMYYPAYLEAKETDRLAQTLVSISVEDVATALKADKHLLFGYLRYLDRKYKVASDQPNTYSHLYMPKVAAFRHAVDFPYLAAILAGHEHEQRKFNWSLWLSVLAIGISLMTFASDRFDGQDASAEGATAKRTQTAPAHQ